MFRAILFCMFIVLLPFQAHAFCGFYVAKADTSLFNESSKVVMVRDGDRNVVTMANDFSGDVDEFAVVVPVPTLLEREQIHVTDRSVVEHIDAYTAPRLVEYFDDDPCRPQIMYKATALSMALEDGVALEAAEAENHNVTIEAQYTVDEYDILILSAKESHGLVAWLKQNGYKMPEKAESVVGSYLKQGMKFFVAKVNLKNYEKGGYSYLRPLQIAYEHDRFMLPIRLGTVNAKAEQELFVFALTRTGRVETTNYRTVKLPSNVEIPSYIKSDDKFADFYRDMFRQQVKRERGKAVFLEYAWDMNWCDPCAADPLSTDELRELGVFWVGDKQADTKKRPVNPQWVSPNAGQDVYVTRLHVRYDQAHFPEDLMFQATPNRENFQGRYIIRHPWRGKATCDAATKYIERDLPERLSKESERLARLTGWDIHDIRKDMSLPKGDDLPTSDNRKWWQDLWRNR